MTQSKAVSSDTDTTQPSTTKANPTTDASKLSQTRYFWSPFRWLSISVGVVLFGSCFYWGWNPDLTPTPPHYSISLGLIHLLLFGLFSGFFRSLFLQQAQQTDEQRSSRTAILLGTWLFVAAGALGLLGAPGALAGVVMFVAGWIVLLFHKLDDWFGTLTLASKASSRAQAIFKWYELSLWGVLWLAVSIVVSLYGLWFAIAAPFLSIVCAIFWLFWHKDRTQRSAIWWIGLVGLLVTPFFTSSIASRNQIPTHGLSNHPGFLLAVQHAPFWTAEQRIKMLLADNVSSYLPPKQRTKVYIILTRLWLNGTISSPMHKELAKYMSIRWLKQLQHDDKLQKAVLQKMLQGFLQYRKTNGGIGYQYDLQQELVDIHKQFPHLRKTLETSLLQALVTLAPCPAQQSPCSQQNAQTWLKTWQSDMLRLGKSQHLSLPNYFPLNDLLWATYEKLPLSHQQRFNTLISYLRSQTLQSSTPQSAFARIFLYSIFQSENFFLKNMKPKASRARMDRWLVQLIQHDLRSNQREYQFMGFMLFGQVCRSQQNGLALAICNQLVRLFQPPAWKAFRAQSTSKNAQKLIQWIEKPSLDLSKRMEMERKLLSIRLKDSSLVTQKNRHLGVLIVKGNNISKEERAKQLQAIKKLDLQSKKLEQQKKQVEAAYRMDVPHTSAASPTSQSTTRPTHR